MGLTISICYRQKSVIADIEIKERVLKIDSVIGWFPLQAGPLKWDSTVYNMITIWIYISSWRVFSQFLVACTRLYTSLCRSVGWSKITSRFWAFRAKRRTDFSFCPATILPLPTHTWLMLPCIRPCFSLKTLLLDQNYWLRSKKYKR